MYQSNLFERSCLEHPEMRIILVCFNEKCQANRLLCAKCNLEHPTHTDKLYDINTLEQNICPLISASNEILDCYNIPIDNIISHIKQLKKIIAIKQSRFLDHLKDEIDQFYQKKCQLHNNDILMICKKKMCGQIKYVCCDCIDNHKNHSKCLLDKEKFKLVQEKMMKKLDLKITNLTKFIDIHSQQLAQFKKQLFEKYQITTKTFMLMNNKNINHFITILQNFVGKNQSNVQATIQFFLFILKQMDLCSNLLEVPNKSNAQQQDKIRTQNYKPENVQQDIINCFDKTINIFGKCLEESCQYVSLYKGNVLSKLKQYDQSLYWIDQEIRINSKCEKAFFSKGCVLKEQKQYQESLEQFNRVLMIKCDHIEALCQKGDCLYWLDNYKEALDIYEKALKIQRNNKVALKGKGNTLVMLRKYQKSIEWFNKALDINPNDEEALGGKGQALRLLNKFQQSIEWYDKALIINPNYVFALSGKGQALRLLDQYQESIKWFDKALVINPNDEDALGGKGEALRLLDKYQESIKWFDKVLVINPNDEDALSGKGQALRLLEKYQESIQLFNKALAVNPNYVFALGGKGEALRMLGEYQESIQLFNKALAINPNSVFAKRGKSDALKELDQLNKS